MRWQGRPTPELVGAQYMVGWPPTASCNSQSVFSQKVFVCAAPRMGAQAPPGQLNAGTPGSGRASVGRQGEGVGELGRHHCV